MNPTALAWLVVAAMAVVVALVVAFRRRRAHARRAYGPQGVGEALERGRSRLRRPHDP